MSTGGPPTAEREGERAVLSLRGVRVVRDGRPLLEDIDWAVYPGERWVILGPNGSGKTTLLRVAGRACGRPLAPSRSSGDASEPSTSAPCAPGSRS